MRKPTRLDAINARLHNRSEKPWLPPDDDIAHYQCRDQRACDEFDLAYLLQRDARWARVVRRLWRERDTSRAEAIDDRNRLRAATIPATTTGAATWGEHTVPGIEEDGGDAQ